MRRRTKIVATIGPASASPTTLSGLIAAGMDVARLGLAHGHPREHVERIAKIRAAADGRPVGVLADLPGPKIRTGEFPESGVFLAEGSEVALRPGSDPSSSEDVFIDYEPLLADVEPGDRIVLGDGAVMLRVETAVDSGLRAVVVHGGRVQGRPGAHLPADRVSVSAPTSEDLRLLEIVAEAEVDMVAVSFVRSARDLRVVRDAIGAGGPKIVAKIETQAAVQDLDAIIQASDGVMVARGDLGTECPIEEVPHLQKRIVRACVSEGIPVITATQMLESMVHAPSPTRAEASDVANAVFDGTDAVMLSAETAIGHNPIATVRTMARIAERAEQEADYAQWGGRLGRTQRYSRREGPLAITAATTHAAWRAALELDARAILCCTRTGTTARAMARFRPTATLLGLSPDVRTVRQLTLSWGIQPLAVAEYGTTDEMVWCVVEAALRAGEVDHGDIVIVLAGSPEDPDSPTDVLRVVRLS